MDIKKIYDRCFEIGVIIIMILWFCVADIDSKSIQSEISTQNNIEIINKIDTIVPPVNEIIFAEYPYKVSIEGKRFIQSHESLRLEAYNDPSPTKRSIGWGHQIQPGENYTVITKEQADKIFEQDIKRIEASVNRLLKKTNPNFKYTQGFIDGMASLIYNCGEHGVSTTDFYQRLLKCRLDNSEDSINESDLNFTLAAVKTSKVFCEGHRIRRANEYKLMLN
jgi:GH24 family phage-related lysozyme (muramidase)